MPHGNENYRTFFLDETGREALLTEIEGRYPAEKPVCFNYIRAREDISLLCEAIQELTGSPKNMM